MTTATNLKILFVDDDPNVLAAMQRNLRRRFVLEVAISGSEALEILRSQGPFAVIVADMSMPVMNGVELLEAVQVESPDTVRIMLTGNADQRTAAEAVNRGNVFRFLSKPCTPEALAAALDTALKEYELLTNEKALLNQTLKGSLQVLTDILAMLDADAFGQAQLRSRVAREVAIKLGHASTWDVEIAALLAEIGIVTLPPGVMEKARTRQTMTPKERHLVERIPEFSSRLLAAIPRLETVAQAVLYQNKNFDGSGFPVDNISRAEIPIGARILRVVNEVVRMHNKGLSLADVVDSLKAGPERYDLAVVREVAACGSVLQASPKANANSMRSVPLAELAPGYVLLSDITTAEGAVVVCVGTVLNATQLQRLRNFASLHPVVEPIAVDIPSAAQRGSRQWIDQIALP
jgi:response regulator RpfG family c-di-GMP phosphodiesterase